MKNKQKYTTTLSGKNIINYAELFVNTLQVAKRALTTDASHPSNKVKNLDKNFCDWFRGFTDAEGSFNISQIKEKFYSFSFQLKLDIDDINALNYIQNTMGIGKVYKSKSSPTCKFIVSKQSSPSATPLHSLSLLRRRKWRVGI
uniref:LAGLIDADG endonuclease n=1 Tax=Juglanconis oblonga TaxID=1940568 RepID=A0A291LII8_9PEZI|nr:LAGLIDADG endonuclease [Juglanconis oblonga]ATI20355.1 hypothetical protein [Juglanconis oblonga]